MDLTGKRILVIGGAGFIGSHTIDLLLKENIKELFIFDNLTRGSKKNIENSLKDNRVNFINDADILDYQKLLKWTYNSDAVLHFAALWLNHCINNPRYALEVNILGTFNVIQACKEASIEKLIFSSSASVYGDTTKSLIDEDTLLQSKNFYGATKISCEALMRSFFYQHNLNYLGLRYMNVYGPRQDYKGRYVSVILKMLDAIDRDRAPTIFGNGNDTYDFISVEDCAMANICALKSNKSNQFYNVGTGIKTSLKELAQNLIKIRNKNLLINYIENKESYIDRDRVGDILKAKKELKFQSKISLDEGLKRLIKWRDNDLNLI